MPPATAAPVLGFLSEAPGRIARVHTFPLSDSAPRVRDVVRHETRRRRLTVLASRAVPGGLIRLTLGGDDLADFTSLGPEDHVKLFVSSEGGTVGRDYTPSEFRPLGASSGPELDLDVVVHENVSGPASDWAADAAQGDAVEIGGPRGSRLAPTGFRNAVLIADPTGLPALRRWIRALAGATPLRAVLFGRADAGYLDEAELGAATPQVLGPDHDLLAVVRAQDVDDDTFVWAAGEAATIVPVRRHLKEIGLPSANRSLHGYWKRGDAGFDHHAPLDPADPED